MEIIFLSLFIISLFIPYVWGIRPKEFFWDIWGSSMIDRGWSVIVIVSFPLILSFVLLILISVKPTFGKLTLKLVTWLIIIIYSFIMVLFLIEEARSYNPGFLGGHVTTIIFPLAISLFLFVLTIVKSKDNYLKIENYILSIITLPVAFYFFGILEFEFGGYLLNISFAVLYVIAVLKVFLLKKMRKTLPPETIIHIN
jgi:hypothetical protein